MHSKHLAQYLLPLALVAMIGCNSAPEQKTAAASPPKQVAASPPAPAKTLSIAEKNLIDSEAFLKENGTHPGVVQTSSGLQYRKLTNGAGCHATADATVTLHYDARLAGNDTPIDSSYQRNVPGVFPLKKMIPAWKEGVPLMQEGDIWEFYVHPKLAYGKKGSPPLIQPNVAMIFKVELLKAGRCR
jgi:FKBP-type peptidyl-prolyl cis-trans isomerase